MKRSNSVPIALPMVPRRGRAAVTDTELWGDSGRMVLRKVEPSAAAPELMLQNLQGEMAVDRAAIMQLYDAVKAIAGQANIQAEGAKDLERRLDEQTRMRMDDHRLNVAAVNHVRTGVEALEGSQGKFKDYIDSQDKAVLNELENKMEGIKGKLNEMVPTLVESKLAAIATSLEQIRKAEEDMKTYLNELERARPEEGKMVFSAFNQLRQEVANVATAQAQQAAAQAAATAGLFSATAAAVRVGRRMGGPIGPMATHDPRDPARGANGASTGSVCAVHGMSCGAHQG